MSAPQQQLQIALEFLKTSYRFDTFQEPRGVMRVFQFVFAIWGFFACRDFSVTINMDCDNQFRRQIEIEYPFEYNEGLCYRKVDNSTLTVAADSSTGAQFFVITAVLSILYAVFIIFVYAYLDQMYKSKPEFPMADFALTAALAFFWLFATFGFSSCGSALEKTFDETYLARECSKCVPRVSSFKDLTIALMIGYLNVFLWASDLWFLYKETIWFQQRNQILNQQMFPGQPQQFAGQQQQFTGQEQFGGQQQQFGSQPQYEQQQQQPQQYGYDQQQQQQQPQQQQQQFGGYEQSYGQQQYGQQQM